MEIEKELEAVEGFVGKVIEQEKIVKGRINVFVEKIKGIWNGNKGKITSGVVIAGVSGVVIGYFFDWVSGLVEFFLKVIEFIF